jgi:hypothetical protein
MLQLYRVSRFSGMGMVEWGMVEQWNGGMDIRYIVVGRQFHKCHAVSSGELMSL